MSFVDVDYDPFAPKKASPAAPAVAPAQTAFDRALAAEGASGKFADTARSLFQQESSSGKNTKTSNAGAVGPMQVIPTTFSSVADKGWDINNEEHNIRAGLRYAKQGFDKSGGDPALTGAYYYGGPGGMEKARAGVAVRDPRNPNAPDTLQYGQQVASRVGVSADPTPAKGGFVDVDYDPFAAKPATNTPAKTANPYEANSFAKNTLLGVGKAAGDLKMGLGQRTRETLEMVAPETGKKIADAAGLSTQAVVDAKRKIDAPLMETAGGQFGDFVGGAIPAIAAMRLPGGQSLRGMVAGNAALGLATPTGTGESAIQNAAISGAGGAAGYGVAKGIGMAADKLTASAATKAVERAPVDKIATLAKDAGFVLPPAQTNPGFLSSALEGFAGKISTAQKASGKNQPTINELAAKELGLNPAQPITVDALKTIRQQAGQAYDAVASAGTIAPTSAYTKALDDIVKPHLQAAAGFPNAPLHPVIKQIEALRSAQFDAGSAVAKIKELRAQADTAYRGGDKELGKALKSGANALEDAIDKHLSASGAPTGLLQGFRDARQTIAKTYSVEKALNETTSNVNAGKLAGQLAKGKPLSGGLKTIAETARAFPEAVKEPTRSMPGVSPLDFFGANLLNAAGAGAGTILTAGMRPVVRAGILSKPYQATLGTPSYKGSGTLNALASQPGQFAIQAGVPSAIRELAYKQQPAIGAPGR